MYNLLPQTMIDMDSVHGFQRKLQGLLKEQARKNALGWETLYSPRHPLHVHPLARLLHSLVTANGKIVDMDSTPDPCLDDGDGDMVAMDVLVPFFGGEDRPPSWW